MFRYVVIYSHRKEVGSHEIPEGVEDHLPREHRPDALLLGRKRSRLQGSERVLDRESGGSPEENRAQGHGSEGALDVRRNHRDARAVIPRVCGTEDAIGTGEDPADKPANPHFKVPDQLIRAHSFWPASRPPVWAFKKISKKVLT